jgi:hypothetical protein
VAASSSSLFRPLLGRESQLAVARAHLDALARHRGGLLVLDGAAGIGKTRLAEEIVVEARERNMRTAWSTAWHGDGAPALWPWVQVLRQLTGSASVLEQESPMAPIASAAARFAQMEALASHVVAAATEAPVLVVLDDLHWADATSIEAVTFVADAVRDAPCLLVATYRPDEMPRGEVAALARTATTLALPGLPPGPAADLLRASVCADVPKVAVDAVVDRSGGNPLFVWEFGQLMAQSGRSDIAPAAVPGAVAAVIERRLARLPEHTVALLQAMAVLGTAGRMDVIASIADADVEDATASLVPAVDAGLVVRHDDTLTVAFHHEIVCDVVLDGIEPRRRSVLHRRAAATLRERLPVDPSLHAVVAEHLSRAGPAHLRAAADHWERAGEQAMRVLAYTEAAGCFGRASAAEGDDPSRRAELLVAQGDALVLAGDLEGARTRYTEAVAGARLVPDAELLARAVLGMGTGPVAWEVPVADEEHARVVGEALDLLPPDATALRSMLLARLSVAGMTPDDGADVARRRAEEAVELARATGEPALLGQALAALNDALGGPAHTVTRRENADTIVELAVVADDRSLELLGLRFRIVADLEAGDLAAVDRDIATFSRLADEVRQPLISWYVPLFRGMRALLDADVASADRLHAVVAEAAQRTGSRNAGLLALALRFGIDVMCGRPTSPHLLDDIGIDPVTWGNVGAGLAMAAWHGGDDERAGELLDVHVADGFRRLAAYADYLVSLLFFGRVAVGLDRPGAVETVYDLLVPHAGLWMVDAIGACCWGPVDLELARLAVALGRTDDARGHLSAARASMERAGAALFAPQVAALEHQCGVAADPPPARPERGVSSFRREGQFWALSFDGRTVHMRHAKGLDDLARLLGEPGRERHVLDLAGGVAGGSPVGDQAGGDLGTLLDDRARDDYRRRLADLDDELADAEACADIARVEKARTERDFLVAELSAALGLGGRPRRAGDPAERARKAVSGRIRLAIDRIEHEHPALGRHLRHAVRTGTYCVYDPEVPTAWVV